MTDRGTCSHEAPCLQHLAATDLHGAQCRASCGLALTGGAQCRRSAARYALIAESRAAQGILWKPPG